MSEAQTARDSATVVIDSVSHWYGNVVAVNDISITLEPGITGLLGPNGAGKSTLLHMMAGFLKPSAGDVRILGQPAWRNPEIYRRVGLVPEKEAVYSFLTGYQFVQFSARLHELPDPDAATRKAIDLVDMGFAQDRQTGGYSKGMKQRIKIAAAIVHDPEILLLDEPFNGADPRQRLQMMDILRDMARQGKTILFSSHILEEMERLGERVLVVVAGRLAASGDFRAIRRLMTDRPHTFTLRSTDNRRLAGALLAGDWVSGVEVVDDAIRVSTSDFGRFIVETPRVARTENVTLVEVAPLDESLESVFEYLVAR